MRTTPNITVVAVMSLIAGCTGSPTPVTSAPPTTTPRPIAPPTVTNTLTVQGVQDGRTVLLSDGARIRIAGLAEPQECWAGAATAFAKAFLLDKPVKVDPTDPTVVDEAPLWMADGTEYALIAVSQGVLRGDSPHDPAFQEAETAATKAGLGLWGDPCRGQAKPPTSTQKTPPPATTTRPAPTPTAPPVFGCAISYRVTYRWNNGYNADVTITNTGNRPITGWTLRWTFTRGQVVTDIWNATVAQSGAEVIATSVSYSATIPAGGMQVVGYTGQHRADNPAPIEFSLNGHPCPVTST